MDVLPDLSQSAVFFLLILYAVVELAKYGFDKIGARKSMLTDKERYWLSDLHEMHNVKDSNGRLLWYTPKELIENQREMMQALQSISKHQRDIARSLERSERNS